MPLKYLLLALFFFTLVRTEGGEEESEDEDSNDYEDFTSAPPDTTEGKTSTLYPTISPTLVPTNDPTTTTILDTTSTQIDEEVAIRIVRFDADFDAIIGTRQDLFLFQCDEFWLNQTIAVSCVHVQSGSILLNLFGSSEELDRAESILEETGMDLPDFDFLQLENDTPEIEMNANQSDNSNITSEIWFLILLFSFGAVCAIGCVYISRTKCFDNEEGFVSMHGVSKIDLKIEHENTNLGSQKGELNFKIPAAKRHIGLAVRDGSNAFDVEVADGLGNTPNDAPNNHQYDSFEEGGGPTGFSVENLCDFPQFVRQGEPSIVSIEDAPTSRVALKRPPLPSIIPSKKPTSGIVRIDKVDNSISDILVVEKPTSGIVNVSQSSSEFIPAQRNSIAVSPVSASL